MEAHCAAEEAHRAAQETAAAAQWVLLQDAGRINSCYIHLLTICNILNFT